MNRAVKIILMLVFLTSCFWTQPAEARGLFKAKIFNRGKASRNNSRRVSSPNKVPSSDRQTKPATTTSSDRGQPTKVVKPQSKWLAGSTPQRPVYPNIGPVKAVHLRPKDKKSAGWTLYAVETKDGYPLYRIKNEEKGVVSGDGKGPSTITVSNSELDVWIMSDDNKWVRPKREDGSYGKYGPKEIQYYLDYNREAGSILVNSQLDLDKELIAKALGVKAKDLDLSAAKGVLELLAVAADDSFKSGQRALGNAVTSGLDQLSSNFGDFSNKLREGYIAYSEEAQALAEAEGVGFSIQKQALNDLASAVASEIAIVPAKLAEWGNRFKDVDIEAVASQLNLAEVAADLKAAEAMLAASRQQDKELAFEYLERQTQTVDSQYVRGDDPFDRSLRESLAVQLSENSEAIKESFKTSSRKLATPFVDGFEGLDSFIGAGRSELDNLGSNFKDFGDKLTHSYYAKERESMVAAKSNPHGVPYAFIDNKIPHPEAYHRDRWRPIENMPLTYNGEKITKAITGQNLHDSRPDTIIAYWRQDGGFEMGIVRHYLKNVGSIPREHFQNQVNLSKLAGSQPEMQALKNQKLEKLTNTNCGVGTGDQDSYGGPSAERWQMEQQIKQQTLSRSVDTTTNTINRYLSIYDTIVKRGGYRELVEKGRPDYLSGEITARIHYGILAQCAAKQAGLAWKQGEWRQSAAWWREYGKHKNKMGDFKKDEMILLGTGRLSK